ncbi:hypothetical protein C9374_003474 [Naegleria lovaniensis]|uniref:Uncharacterized protein n=1 Tax=Naegleria lovaniensis TaxID=51637 RepID=A0AA88KLB2_NAELO|nr:uncharacterized protein C9374_003474 [Naegleria lovaniensis]KAG2385659.1 hypothetical protein C9374_003474 [Naegleria lovaniensis]
MKRNLHMRDRTGQEPVLNHADGSDTHKYGSNHHNIPHPHYQAAYNLDDAVIASILGKDKYLYDEYYHRRVCDYDPEAYFLPLRRKPIPDQNPLYVLDLISTIWSFIPENYWLSSLVNLMLTSKRIASLCLSKEALLSVWMNSPGFYVNSEGLLTFMLKDLLEVCKMYGDNLFANLSKTKLTISHILKLCNNGLSLTEKFETVTLHRMFVSQKSLVELLGMQSRIKYLKFDECKTLQDVQRSVTLKTRSLIGLSFLNSEITFPDSTTFPTTLHSLEFCNALSDSDQEFLKQLTPQQLKTLKLWNHYDIPRHLFSASRLNHVVLPGLHITFPKSVFGLTLVSLTYPYLSTLADDVRQNKINPYKQIKSLAIRNLDISRIIPLTTFIEALFVVFPKLKYLTLPESIIYNTKANLEQKNNNDDDENYTVNTIVTQDETQFVPTSLVQVKILHTSTAWKFFLECLLYEIQMEYPSLNIHTALELVDERTISFRSGLISTVNWEIPKSWLNKRTEEFFNKIHNWYRMYNDYPKVRRKIDGMRRKLITLCAFTNPVPSDTIADLNDSMLEFEGMSLFSNQVLDLRKKQLSIFSEYVPLELCDISKKMKLLLQVIENEFDEDVCIGMEQNVSESRIGMYIHELSVFVKELESVLIERDVSTMVLRPNEWYSEDIVEVYDNEDDELIDIEIDFDDDENSSTDLDDNELLEEDEETI